MFAAGNQSAERRSFRTSRRRLDRRQQRVKLVQEIFAPVISPIDPRFFIRLHESALWRDDVADRKSTRLNSSHGDESRMPSSA